MEVDGRSNGNGKMLVMLCFLVCKSAAGSLSPMCTLRTRAVWSKHCHPKLYFNNYFFCFQLRGTWLLSDWCHSVVTVGYLNTLFLHMLRRAFFDWANGWTMKRPTIGGGFISLAVPLSSTLIRVCWEQMANSLCITMDESTHYWYLTNSLQRFVIHLGQNHQMIAMICHHITPTREEKDVNRRR